VPHNDDTCASCGIECGTEGDYWHKTNKVFLCRPCMTENYLRPKRKRRYDPEEFQVYALRLYAIILCDIVVFAAD
jgi:hypothetical protein